MNCFFVDSKIFYGLTFNAQKFFLHKQCVNDWRKHPLDAFALVSYLRRFVYLVTFHNEKVSIGLVIPSVLRFGVQAGIFSCRRTVPPPCLSRADHTSFYSGSPKTTSGSLQM